MSTSSAKRRRVGEAIRAAREKKNLTRPEAARLFATMLGGRGGSVANWRIVEDAHDGKGNESVSTPRTLAAMAMIVGLDPKKVVSDYGLDPDKIPEAVYQMSDEDDDTVVFVLSFGKDAPDREDALRRARRVLEEEFGPGTAGS